jgi:hypothetical protein
MSKVFVINKSSEAIECFISKYTNSKGSDEWYKLNGPDGSDTWDRGAGWELVAFRRPASGINPPRAGVYIYIQGGKTVTFYNFGNILVH